MNNSHMRIAWIHFNYPSHSLITLTHGSSLSKLIISRDNFRLSLFLLLFLVAWAFVLWFYLFALFLFESPILENFLYACINKWSLWKATHTQTTSLSFDLIKNCVHCLLGNFVTIENARRTTCDFKCLSHSIRSQSIVACISIEC